MPINVFVVGLPGSGKSAACRAINDFLQNKGIAQITHLSDFDMLKEMAEQDQNNPPPLRRFELTPYGGFNIKPPFAPFNEALQQVNAWLRQRQASEWVLIEFARNDYLTAFAQFEDRFLRDAFFLFLEAPRESCRQRLHRRVRQRQTPDDHFVSDHIFDTYYKSIAPFNIAHFCTHYALAFEQVDVVVNNSKSKYFTEKVQMFARRTLRFQQQRARLAKTMP